jgi:segregation and condensation protein A
MQSISLDQAGEFIAMAATLLVIKMKMLMPSRIEEEEETEEDPRAELVRRLLEYKRFKEAALAFQEREDERSRFHTRQLKFPFTSDLAVEPALRIEMFDLLAALAGIYDRVRKRPVHDVVREPFTVEEKIELIAGRTTDGALVRFEELFADDTIKMEVVVTFIAILEMVKRGRLVFVQTEPLGPIWLQRPAAGVTTGADPDIDEPYAPEASSESMLAPASARPVGSGDEDEEEDDGWSKEDLDDEDDDDDIDWDDDDLDDVDEDDDSDDIDAVKGGDDVGVTVETGVIVSAKADDDDDDEADDDDEDDEDWDDDDDEDWDDDDDDVVDGSDDEEDDDR